LSKSDGEDGTGSESGPAKTFEEMSPETCARANQPIRSPPPAPLLASHRPQQRPTPPEGDNQLRLTRPRPLPFSIQPQVPGTPTINRPAHASSLRWTERLRWTVRRRAPACCAWSRPSGPTPCRRGAVSTTTARALRHRARERPQRRRLLLRHHLRPWSCASPPRRGPQTMRVTYFRAWAHLLAPRAPSSTCEYWGLAPPSSLLPLPSRFLL
jgi:hypothetical protein